MQSKRDHERACDSRRDQERVEVPEGDDQDVQRFLSTND
jgi:hypothetical protein